MTEITLNGRPLQTAATNLASLAAELSPAPQTLLLELNEEAVPPSQWDHTPLKTGDTVEVLRVSAGG